MNHSPSSYPASAWKRRSVRSIKRAEQFLHETASLLFDAQVGVSCSRNGIKIKRECGELLFDCDISCWRNTLNIPDYKSYTDTSGVGSIAHKAVLGMMAELNTSHLVAETVCDDGYIFWPGMGYLPILGRKSEKRMLSDDLSTAIEKLFEVSECFGNTVTQQTVSNYIEACEKIPLHVFRAASQSLLKVGNQPIYRFLLEKLDVEADDYVLLPCEPGTQAILKRRLGRVPDFPPVTLAKEYPYFWKHYTKEKKTLKAFMEGRTFAPQLTISPT